MLWISSLLSQSYNHTQHLRHKVKYFNYVMPCYGPAVHIIYLNYIHDIFDIQQTNTFKLYKTYYDMNYSLMHTKQVNQVSGSGLDNTRETHLRQSVSESCICMISTYRSDWAVYLWYDTCDAIDTRSVEIIHDSETDFHPEISVPFD